MYPKGRSETSKRTGTTEIFWVKKNLRNGDVNQMFYEFAILKTISDFEFNYWKFGIGKVQLVAKYPVLINDRHDSFIMINSHQDCMLRMNSVQDPSHIIWYFWEIVGFYNHWVGKAVSIIMAVLKLISRQHSMSQIMEKSKSRILPFSLNGNWNTLYTIIVLNVYIIKYIGIHEKTENDLKKNPYCITIHPYHTADYLLSPSKKGMISMSTFNKNITSMARLYYNRLDILWSNLTRYWK